MNWIALLDDCCPDCESNLVLFEHLKRWKCACGFYIPCHIAEKVRGEISSNPDFAGISSGYGYRPYEFDSPF